MYQRSLNKAEVKELFVNAPLIKHSFMIEVGLWSSDFYAN